MRIRDLARYTIGLVKSQRGGLRGAAILWALGAPGIIVLLALFARGC
jgi:hypothetical protein